LEGGRRTSREEGGGRREEGGRREDSLTLPERTSMVNPTDEPTISPLSPSPSPSPLPHIIIPSQAPHCTNRTIII